MTIITLTTDFGLADGYVGIMKGVILSIAPDVRLVDLSHEIAPQDVRQAAYVLARAVLYFPAGTIHLAVVDPGVGGRRRPLLVRTGRAFYVGPDNGLFTLALAESGAQAFELDRPAFWRPAVSRTFHGRDIFAPVAAHLATGVPPERLGRPITDPVRLELPQPARHPDGRLTGQVVYVDRFGNLISDVPAAWVVGGRWRGEIAGQQIAGLSGTYAEAAPGALVALIGSEDTVEIAVRDGNAAQQLVVRAGEPVVLWSVA
jgi:S-adenosylmethionine hydrolase